MVANENRDVFGGTYFMESMRNSGYDTLSALAEIIDNAVEANADHIEIICVDKLIYGKRTKHQLDSIAIFDDGVGMSEEDLWNSLLMGEGTRRNTKKIGKFGMGLPNSSISQCKNVIVYSWKEPGKVYSTHMDLDKPNSGKIVAPRPSKTKIPDIWNEHFKYINMSKSGTLVVWSKLDKIQWSTAKSLIKNSENYIGRIYRKFLSRDKLLIRLVNLHMDTNKVVEDRAMKPNDPIYQTIPSNTPKPWHNKKMFEPDGDQLEEIIEVAGNDVKIRYAYAKKEARKTKNGQAAGKQDHGKHTNQNLGISLVRADRELYMDRRLCQTYDPLERWWGVEVDFPVELDDVFGVTNNKQNAVNFSTITKKIGAISRNEEDDVIDDDDDELFELVKKINARIRRMRTSIKNTNKETEENGTSGGGVLPWDDGSGPGTIEIDDENLTDAEKETLITEVLALTDPEGASKIARNIIEKKIKVRWQTAAIGGNDFFEVSLKGGVAIITLSTEHVIYKYLGEILNSIPDDIKIDDARNRLKGLRVAIIASIIAWARMENLAMNQADRDNLEDIRRKWGIRINKLVETIVDDNKM